MRSCFLLILFGLMQLGACGGQSADPEGGSDAGGSGLTASGGTGGSAAGSAGTNSGGADAGGNTSRGGLTGTGGETLPVCPTERPLPATGCNSHAGNHIQCPFVCDTGESTVATCARMSRWLFDGACPGDCSIEEL